MSRTTKSTPQTMRAIQLKAFGSDDMMEIAHIPIPMPKDNEVLIKVEAAGINRPDILQRKGKYPPPQGASSTLGLEVAGTIVSCGNKVSSQHIGRKICALVTGGGYADYCVANVALCLDIPENLSTIEASALPETFFTVWSNVFMRAGLQKNESFLVHGGASGIGSTAIQLAHTFGAVVYTTTGSTEKCRICEKLGAKLAINYKENDFAKILKEQPEYAGMDVILDMVGAPYLSRNLDLLNPEGSLVFIAFLGGYETSLDLRPIMLKRLTVTGSTLRAREDPFKAKIAGDLKEKVWPLLEKGTIKPLIYKSFPLEDAASAHALLESGTSYGKLVLTMGA